ncbi:hypothetical protein [Haloarcula marismortui]|uniref:DUF8160 domain-containing protein n=1 Tax=Haloarcula marismortui ATCC 33799 TaxID=662475 RepID=M0L185_9EURY|nr:hypothetical protein [Haloarcula californiae]EMA26848.1 hypothetical protein C435_00664 [Haloarcula californiae ATCC 33799]
MSGDDLDDRLSRRFDADGDGDDNESLNDTKSQTDMSSSTSQNAQKNEKAQNIKKEWNVRSFYLDDDLDDEVTTAFKRLDLALSESNSDVDLKKTRHFYPLLVELGLEQVDEMDVEDIAQRLEGHNTDGTE